MSDGPAILSASRSPKYAIYSGPVQRGFGPTTDTTWQDATETSQ
jgi:hypothetical protein